MTSHWRDPRQTPNTFGLFRRLVVHLKQNGRRIEAPPLTVCWFWPPPWDSLIDVGLVVRVQRAIRCHNARREHRTRVFLRADAARIEAVIAVAVSNLGQNSTVRRPALFPCPNSARGSGKRAAAVDLERVCLENTP